MELTLPHCPCGEPTWYNEHLRRWEHSFTVNKRIEYHVLYHNEHDWHDSSGRVVPKKGGRVVEKPKRLKRIEVDLDGTMLPEGPFADRYFQPAFDRTRFLVNKAVAEGHWVLLYSARPWPEYRLTADWLNRHGIHYTLLMLGKPVVDFVLNDRASSNPDDLEKFLDS